MSTNRDREHPSATHWLETDLDDDWTAAFRLVVQGEQTVVAEVRIIPTRGARGGLGPSDVGGLEALAESGGLDLKPIAAELSDARDRELGEWRETEAQIPGGGVPAEALRAVPLREAKSEGHLRARDLAKKDAPFVRMLAEVLPELEMGSTSRRGLEAWMATVTPLSGRPSRPGPPSRSAEFYLGVSAVYLEEVRERGRNGTRARTAQRLGPGHTPDYVRKVLSAARDLDYLSRPSAGRAGGHLTRRGRTVAEEMLLSDQHEPLHRALRAALGDS